MKILRMIMPVTLAAMLISGCEKLKDFGDTNVSPNATTIPNTAALLTNVLAGVSARATQQNPGYFAQYFAETQYPTVSLYSTPQFDFDGIYAGALYDCQNIINVNTDPSTAGIAAANGSNQNQVAIAKILKAYYFWTISDAWGDIPYSEALTISNNTPKYDRQEDVYKGIIAELTAVVEQFDNGAPVKGDIVFGSSDNATTIGKWKKLANSIRLLMALRLSKKYPNGGEYAAQQFNLANSHPAGVIEKEDNSDNFAVVYPGGNFRSPWFAAYDARDDVGESLQFVNLLGSLADSRQIAYGSSTNGVPYGRDRASFMNAWFAANSTTYAKVLAPNLRQPNSRVDIIHAAAVLFAKAEARHREWIVESTAEELYKKAITASFQQWGITGNAVLNTYLAGTEVVFSGDFSARLTKLARQRYIALYPDGLQGWSEWRRTGFPALAPALDAVNTSKAIPRRFVYGTNDYSTNPAAVAAAAAAIPLPVPTPNGAIAGDTQDGRVWWDQ